MMIISTQSLVSSSSSPFIWVGCKKQKLRFKGACENIFGLNCKRGKMGFFQGAIGIGIGNGNLPSDAFLHKNIFTIIWLFRGTPGKGMTKINSYISNVIQINLQYLTFYCLFKWNFKV